jgi:hypothetical protein
MNNNSLILFEKILTEASSDHDSYEWTVPSETEVTVEMNCLAQIANHLQKEEKGSGHGEKINFSVVHRLSNEDQTVTLSIKMHGTLGSLTLEQWKMRGSEIKKSLTDPISKVKRLAESDALTFPQIIVADLLQTNMINESIDDNICTVASKHKKGILECFINLSQLGHSTRYRIDGVEYTLGSLPQVIRTPDKVSEITRVVYVTYFDYLITTWGICLISKNKRIKEITCNDSTQEEKLYAAYRLGCEARIRFATVIKTVNGRPKEVITEILEVIEIFEDKKCPSQTIFCF